MCVELVEKRARAAGLSNVTWWQGRIEAYGEPFEVALALHACGSATDLALAQVRGGGGAGGGESGEGGSSGAVV